MHMISNIFDFEKTKFTLREQVQNPIVSTYLSVKSKLYIEYPVIPFQCPSFHANV